MTKTYLNALGVACPLGAGKAAVSANLARGHAGGIRREPGWLPGRGTLVGRVDGMLPEVPASFAPWNCRNNRLALLAVREIDSELQALVHRFGAARIAVVLGTSTGGMAEAEQAFRHFHHSGAWPDGYRYENQETGNLAACVAGYLGVGGPAYTVGTACSSSGKAMASARRLMAAGLCDAAVVGGCDTLCAMTINGFDALNSLTDTACNPFSRNRDGIVIGEGAAIFILSPDPAPIALMGVGESSDAYHMSAPQPEGDGAIAAMRAALEDAGVDAARIDYLNLHGTATPLNDAMESHAVQRVLGGGVPCSSTKGMTGHMLGAAAGVEAAFLWLTQHPDFTNGLLPPHVWDGVHDDTLSPINLVRPDTPAPADGSIMMSNSFAFGGSNVSLVVGRADG
ncbi:MAG: beta-ketoacyl-[acyl-carrier-protein] synthase family protein [Rhodospirillales bacterium]